MPSLRDRLAAALAPEYRIEDRVGQGGMGAVFKAYDNSLRRWVAIKVLLPKLATEVAARRFLREARTLASLNHPHIVAVHHVGEAKGLFYFVMEYVPGETLAGLIARGPMGNDEVIKLGRDLLDALEAVHDQGRVHCDVKPANIFVTDKRAMLADFGIATNSTLGDETFTVRDFQPHTPQYATPEQAEHREVTPQTDLYSVGTVLYEALTGRKWFEQGATYDPTQADWKGVSRAFRRVLVRALNPDPSQRWSDAREFRRQLWRIRSGRLLVPAAILTAAAGTSGVLLGVFGQQFVTGGGSESIVVVRPDYTRGTNNVRYLTDSLSDFVLDRLRLNFDFRTCGADEGCGRAETELRVSVDRRDSGLVLQTISGDPAATIFVSTHSDNGDWFDGARAMYRDLLMQLFQRETPILEDLPTQALPADYESFVTFAEAERLWHEASWSDALDAYRRASEIDSTCYICSWRITDVLRVVSPGAEPDPIHKQRALDHIELFPPHYQLLIEARLASPVDVRLRKLEEATESARSFFATHFEFGDELLHRGALDGFVLESAARELRAAYNRKTSFAPALEHVVWAHLVLRDTEGASIALQELDSLPTSDEFETQIRLAMAAALAFQMGNAEDMLSAVLRDQPSLPRDDLFRIFARFMMALGTPEGAVGVGRMLEGLGLSYAGLFGQYVGLFAMGQTEAATAALEKSRGIVETPIEFPIFAAQLDAAAYIMDSTLADPTTITAGLGQFRGDSITRESVAFMQHLLRRRSGGTSISNDVAVQDGALLLLDEADSLALADNVDSALAIAESLVTREFTIAVESQNEARPPIFRSMLYLLKSQWHLAVGDTMSAIESLRWHENTDLYKLPNSKPMTYEADWALGTIASWQRAQLLEQHSPGQEMCRLYKNVADLWANGDQPFARMAADATQALRRHQCQRS